MQIQQSPEQLLALLQAALRDAPALKYNEQLTDSDQRWFGRVASILSASGRTLSLVEFRSARNSINTIAHNRSNLLQPIYDVLSELELQVPAALQGAFIPAGDIWNGYAALVKVVQTDCDSLLIVDPYISADIFTELMPHSVARNGTRILTVNQPKLHTALLASAQKWQSTHPAPTPPIEVRYAPATTLHDRLMIADGTHAWLVSQSFKDIAKKSAASVTRADADLAKMKGQHYETLWNSSSPIS